MIDAGYCRVMARYNAWQNKGLRAIVDAMDEDALRHDRGAFFGSIFGTLNHLLWGDLVWMARFAGGDAPPQAIADSPDMTATPVEWSTHRFRTDGRISLWADKLASVDLVGDLTWYSEAAKREVTQPMQTCIVHFFNHQTHHRGQVHAMLTAAGAKPGPTDLPFMPEEF
ncbi:DinB family protein [Octadecabacter sp. SW4]|uniref:DinB family protein n=1 Tax=Octadecabacter sp. SW4 TaxID=2602067 RepID=UPI0020C763F2|nr:DinB family protein [Octadecabacter sp. SW4]